MDSWLKKIKPLVREKDPYLLEVALENKEFPALWPEDHYEEVKKRKAKKAAEETLAEKLLDIACEGTNDS